jgi:thiamine kinase-like enzyme
MKIRSLDPSRLLDKMLKLWSSARSIAPTHLHEDRQARPDFAMEIAGKQLSNIRLLPFGKTGNPSWFGEMDRQPIKIYQAAGPAHAQFIQRLSSHPALERYFPKVLHVQGSHVVAEWIQGTPLNARLIQKDNRLILKTAQMQTLLHMTTLQEVPPGFDYSSFLQDRLKKYLGPFSPVQTILNMTALCRNHASLGQTARISHPDITPRNLVIESETGELKLIDNELLGYNDYYLIDLFNTYHSFDGVEDAGNAYIEAYRISGGDLSPLLEQPDLFLALWKLRRIGSLLQSGRMGEALQLAETSDTNKIALHPLFAAAERMLQS